MELIVENAPQAKHSELEEATFSGSLRDLANNPADLIDESFGSAIREQATFAHRLESSGIDLDKGILHLSDKASEPNIMNGKLSKDAASAFGFQQYALSEALTKMAVVESESSESKMFGKSWYENRRQDARHLLEKAVNEAGAILIKNEKDLKRLAKLASDIPSIKPKHLLLLSKSEIPKALKGIPTTFIGNTKASTPEQLAQQNSASSDNIVELRRSVALETEVSAIEEGQLAA